MGKSKKAKQADAAPGQPKVVCFFCDCEFAEEGLLILHQQTKHFKCTQCSGFQGGRCPTHGCRHKCLVTLSCHWKKDHKGELKTIPGAKEGRDDPMVHWRVHGISGAPEDFAAKVNSSGPIPAEAAPPLPVDFPPIPEQPPLPQMILPGLLPGFLPIPDPMQMVQAPGLQGDGGIGAVAEVEAPPPPSSGPEATDFTRQVQEWMAAKQKADEEEARRQAEIAAKEAAEAEARRQEQIRQEQAAMAAKRAEEEEFRRNQEQAAPPPHMSFPMTMPQVPPIAFTPPPIAFTPPTSLGFSGDAISSITAQATQNAFASNSSTFVAPSPMDYSAIETKQREEWQEKQRSQEWRSRSRDRQERDRRSHSRERVDRGAELARGSQGKEWQDSRAPKYEQDRQQDRGRDPNAGKNCALAITQGHIPSRIWLQKLMSRYGRLDYSHTGNRLNPVKDPPWVRFATSGSAEDAMKAIQSGTIVDESGVPIKAEWKKMNDKGKGKGDKMDISSRDLFQARGGRVPDNPRGGGGRVPDNPRGGGGRVPDSRDNRSSRNDRRRSSSSSSSSSSRKKRSRRNDSRSHR